MGQQNSDCISVSLITNTAIGCSIEDAVSSAFSVSSTVLDLWNGPLKVKIYKFDVILTVHRR